MTSLGVMFCVCFRLVGPLSWEYFLNDAASDLRRKIDFSLLDSSSREQFTRWIIGLHIALQILLEQNLPTGTKEERKPEICLK